MVIQINFSSECSICWKHMQKYSKIYTLEDCGHQFHKKCFGPWLEKDNTCPLDRRKITMIKYGKLGQSVTQEIILEEPEPLDDQGQPDLVDSGVQERELARKDDLLLQDFLMNNLQREVQDLDLESTAR